MSVDEYTESSPWKRRAAALMALLAVLGAGYGIYWFFSGSEDGPTAEPLQTTAVRKGELVSSLTTTGTAASSLTSRLTFQSSGQVKTISVTVGQQVTAGQELGRLDDRDAKRKLETAASNLNISRLKLQQMLEPPKPQDVAAAEQSVASAQAQVASARAALDKALNPPAADVAAVDGSVAQAETALQNAKNNINNAWLSLVNAQKNYCQAPGIVISPCHEWHLPFSDQHIAELTEWVRAPGGPAAQVGTATAAANSLLQANSSYLAARGAVEPAERSLESALAKRTALLGPPDANQLAQLNAAVAAAEAGLAAAQGRLESLLKGPTAIEFSLQRESLRLAEISHEQAQDGVDNLVLKAPFAGSIGAISVNVGDMVGVSTAAITLTNTAEVRIDVTVSEADVGGIKQGQFGIAIFDAMPGQVYLIKIAGVSTAPTVTQGVVTYPAQAAILRGQTLAQNADELRKMSSALQSLSGTSATAGRALGQGTPTASRTPGAGGTPPAGASPRTGGGLSQESLARLLNPPLPAAGMNATIILVLEVKPESLLVPSTAVRRQGPQSFVTIVTPDGAQEQRLVTVAGTDGTSSAISSGVSEGELVAVTGVAPTVIGAATPTPRPPTPPGGVR